MNSNLKEFADEYKGIFQLMITHAKMYQKLLKIRFVPQLTNNKIRATAAQNKSSATNSQ